MLYNPKPNYPRAQHQNPDDKSLKSEWLDHCLRLAGRPSDLYSKNRKILRNQHVSFGLWDDSLSLDDVGYTDKKLSDLERLYQHDESQAKALELWRGRRSDKFGSVAFHCFSHLTKRAGRTGEQGPCLLSVVISNPFGKTAVDVNYRSTELFKKFSADLVFLREVLLKPFGRIDTVTCNVANVTLAPLYFPTVIPHLDDPIAELEKLRQRDAKFHRLVVHESKDLLCGGTVNANFQSAQRVVRHVMEQTNPRIMNAVKTYLARS